MLYVVATPIGNLGDITLRAQQILAAVDLIIAEDTRHSRVLLQHLGINRPLRALHEHNERDQLPMLLTQLQQGTTMALISDAGTPLLSDPGFLLVRAARQAGVAVVPVPGASALLAALMVAGLPTDRFLFAGFPPAKGGARRHFFERLREESATLVLYESPHRILATLTDLADQLGADRTAVLARELTKRFETLLDGTLLTLQQQLTADSDQQRGEMVLLIAGAATPDTSQLTLEQQRIATLLAAELPMKRAATLGAEISGAKRNAIYQFLLQQQVARVGS